MPVFAGMIEYDDTPGYSQLVLAFAREQKCNTIVCISFWLLSGHGALWKHRRDDSIKCVKNRDTVLLHTNKKVHGKHRNE
jgi:hypothetical protein